MQQMGFLCLLGWGQYWMEDQNFPNQSSSFRAPFSYFSKFSLQSHIHLPPSSQISCSQQPSPSNSPICSGFLLPNPIVRAPKTLVRSFYSSKIPCSCHLLEDDVSRKLKGHKFDASFFILFCGFSEVYTLFPSFSLYGFVVN